MRFVRGPLGPQRTAYFVCVMKGCKATLATMGELDSDLTLKYHRLTQHNNGIMDNNEASHQPTEWQCQKCLKPCNGQIPLWQHEKRCFGQKNFTCNFCDYKSVTQAEINCHKNGVHSQSDAKQHVCQDCGNEYKLPSSLLKMAHRSEEKIKCPECPRLFRCVHASL